MKRQILDQGTKEYIFLEGFALVRTIQIREGGSSKEQGTSLFFFYRQDACTGGKKKGCVEKTTERKGWLPLPGTV